MYTTYFKEIRNPAACFLITFKNQDGYKINVYSSLWEDMEKVLIMECCALFMNNWFDTKITTIFESLALYQLFPSCSDKVENTHFTVSKCLTT